jgi:hypothetical protein
MIEPTVGRIVWYTMSNLGGIDESMVRVGRQPMSATITYVHDSRLVNLAVTDHTGNLHGRTLVTLVQEDDTKPGDGRFCEWVPYQRTVVAKEETVVTTSVNLPGRLTGAKS